MTDEKMVEEMRAAIWSACQDPPQGDYALRMRLTYDEAMRAAQAAAAIAVARIEELEAALASIRHHCEPQPSPLAKAIVATCDAALNGDKS